MRLPPPNLPRHTAGTEGGSPSGVPPRHLLQRPNATAQLQLTRFLRRISLGAGVTRSLPSQCSGFPRRPVLVPAGRMTPEPPGNGGDEPPSAGTALAPPAGVAGWRPLAERDGTVCNSNKDRCQQAVARTVTRERRTPSTLRCPSNARLRLMANAPIRHCRGSLWRLYRRRSRFALGGLCAP
jgi:hypothetical protein